MKTALTLIAIYTISGLSSFIILALDIKNKTIFGKNISIIKFLKFSTPLIITASLYTTLKLETYKTILYPIYLKTSSEFIINIVTTTLLFLFIFTLFFIHSTLPKAIYQKKYYNIKSGIFKFTFVNLFILIGLYIINIILITFEYLIKLLPLNQISYNSIMILGFLILIFLYMSYYPSLLNIIYGKKKEENQEAQQTINQLSKKAKLKIKKFSIVSAEDLKTANAWTYGLFRKKIVVTDYLLKNIETKEFETVIAHEIGHAKRNHIWINLAVMLCFIPIINIALYIANKYTQTFEVTFFTYILLFGIYYFLIIKKVSRTLEYKADKYIIKIASQPEAFINAITKISQLNSSKTKYTKFQELFITHPPLEKRIQAYQKALEENQE